MKFYIIEDAYLDHLRAVDSKVPNSVGVGYKQKKPYLGIVLNVEGTDFLAPLSSPKPSHKSSDKTIFMLHDRSDPNVVLGIIALRYMVPAPARVITYLDFSTQDPAYEILLQKQYEYIKTKWGKIQARAEKLYNDVVVDPKPHLKGATCDFQKLILQSATYL